MYILADHIYIQYITTYAVHNYIYTIYGIPVDLVVQLTQIANKKLLLIFIAEFRGITVDFTCSSPHMHLYNVIYACHTYVYVS